MAGWVIAVVAASCIAGYPPIIGLSMFLPVLLYMTGIMGLTLTVSALLNRTVQLMLIAPVFTVTQGVLCGMLVELPDWAGLLYYVSYIFPGRWLMLGADAALNGGNLTFILGLLVCSAAWLIFGLLAVLAGSQKRAAARA
jgi:ABC-type multidrug transport system permease subunit